MCLSKVFNGLGQQKQLDSEKIGELTQLQTDAKGSLVEAVNEVNTKGGDLAQLSTTEKGSLVAAVNEVHETVQKMAEEAQNPNAEEWTFTLTDGSTTTKKVVIV